MIRPDENLESEKDAPAKAKKDALRLLFYRPRSEEELRRRLALKKHSPETVDEAVAFFKKQGLLNDEQFASLYALSRFQSRGVGKFRIRHDLAQKGVGRAAMEKAMQSIADLDEREVAAELVRKRLSSLAGLPLQKKKARLAGFLARRGFSGGLIQDLLEKWDMKNENR